MTPVTNHNKKPKAFTLIELLIVVAIIAILAAIAVPNFLEAQTRSKVSRVQSDMRTMTTGIESYRIDYNVLPRSHRVVGETREYVLSQITTPISYLSSIPQDPFNTVGDVRGNQIITYWAPDYLLGETTVQTLTGPVNIPSTRNRTIFWFYPSFPQISDGNRLGREDFYTLLSLGPDGNFSILVPPEGVSGGFGSLPLTPYDPTNGTLSYGDIIRIN